MNLSCSSLSVYSPPPVFVALTNSGLALAHRLRSSFGLCQIHAYGPRLETQTPVDAIFDDVGSHLAGLFRQNHPIIGLFSTGILIRSLQDCLQDKQNDPPVLAMSEDGSTIIPLLGAHHGGLAIARILASIIPARIAITTSSEGQNIPAIDQPPFGWRCHNQPAFKTIMADLLHQQPVALHTEVSDGGWLSESGLSFDPGSQHQIIVTHKLSPVNNDSPIAVLHPPVLGVGVGCERGIKSTELITLIENCLRDYGLTPNAIACLCSLEIKMNEEAIHEAAAHFDCLARFFTAQELQKEHSRLRNPSEVVYRATGCYGVAEAAALAATGRTGQLLCPKTRSDRSTCAIALAPSPLDARKIGRPRGHLMVLGLGPGALEWMTPEVRSALATSQDIVGYRFYLDQAAPLAPRARRHDFGLGEEIQRVKTALDLATQGRQVALISSGDAGIYGMASLVFETRHKEAGHHPARPKISVLPGITAMQAAASRIGAPLGHDFCAISLSDLLTPWPVIRRRLEAAAQSDFVTALYNPASGNRQTQLAEACIIFSHERQKDTPVIVARNVGREGESVKITTLDQLTTSCLDMLTLVIIGNRQTCLDDDGALYTPRGYPNQPRSRTPFSPTKTSHRLHAFEDSEP